MIERAAAFIEPLLDQIVAVWLLGVTVLSLRLLAGWLSVQRLRRRAHQPADENWQALLRRLAERLRVTRPVKLVESALVEVPTVIGWLSPLILLPASAMTGLTTEQLEALLAHELAHVRRHDYLINLLQTVVETLLFYHPAVWWISHRIRVEREHCCDDVAVQVCGDRLTYAKALVRLEEMRSPTIRLAVSSRGGSLLGRIARIVEPPRVSDRPTGWAVGVSIVAIVAAMFGLSALSPRATDSKSPNEFVVILPNGLQIELLGVAQHPSEGQKHWWRPDGTPLKEAPTDIKIDLPQEFKSGIEIAYRWKCLKELTSSHLGVVMTVQPETHQSWSHSEEGETEGAGVELIPFDPRRQKTITCIVTVFESEERGGTAESEESNQVSVRFENVSLISHQKTRVTVRVDDSEQTLPMRVRTAAQSLSDVRMTVTGEQAVNPLIASGITSDLPRELARTRKSWQWLRSGSLWRMDYDGQIFRGSSSPPELDQWATGFDGEHHLMWDKPQNELSFGSMKGSSAQYAPHNLFWNPMNGGLEPLLKTLARPELKTKPETLNGLEGLRAEYIDENNGTRRWSAFICPSRGYLTLELQQFHNEQLQWETRLSDLFEAATGIWAPRTIHRATYFYTKSGDRRVALQQDFQVEQLQIEPIVPDKARTRIAPEEFRIQPMFGMTIHDHTRGDSYQNDPWWNDLVPFLHEKLAWPQRSLARLDLLHSNLQQTPNAIKLPDVEVVRVSDGFGHAKHQRQYALKQKVDWQQFQGKVTLVVFWDLRDERSGELLSALETLKWRFWRKDLEIIAIHRPERFAAVEPFLRQRSLAFSIFIDAENDTREGVFRDAFSTRGTPSAVLLDHELKVHPIVDARELPQQLTALMKAAGETEVPTFKLVERLPKNATDIVRPVWLELVAKAPKTSQISGQVRDDKGQLISDAQAELLLGLHLMDSTNGSLLVIPDHLGQRVVKSNAQGEFAFSDLPKGEYELTISAPDRAVQKQNVIVTEGQTRQIAVVLIPPEIKDRRSEQSKQNKVNIRFAEKSAEVAKAEWEKMMEANRKVPGSIPATEIERAKRDYNMAVLQIEQAKRELRIHQLELELALGQNKEDGLELTHKTIELRWLRAKAAADLAKVEHDKISDANRRLPGTIPEAETAKARMADEAARSQLERAEIEFQIAAELTKVTELAFTDTPLADVATFLSDYYNIPVELDATAKKFGDSPVTVNMNCADLAEGMMLALHPLPLSYCIDGGRLLFATPEEVQRLGHKLPRSFAEELTILRKADDRIDWEALLRGKGSELDPAVLTLRLSKLLNTDDATVQRSAARGLAQFHFDAAPARPRLEKLTKTKDERVARTAWFALVSIGREDFSTLPLLLAELDRGGEVFGTLWQVLLQQFDEKVWIELAKVFPTSSPNVRAMLAASLRHHPNEALPVALLALDDAEHRVRRTALRNIHGLEPSEKLVSALHARLKDSALDIRPTAALCLLSFGTADAAALDLLLSEVELADPGRSLVARQQFLWMAPKGMRPTINALDLPSRAGTDARKFAARRALAILAVRDNQWADGTTWGPTRAGLRTRLSLIPRETPDGKPLAPRIGQPIKLQLELTNIGKEPFDYDAQHAGVNRSLTVLDPEGRPVKYIGLQDQTDGTAKTIQPRETHVIVETLDLTAQYDIQRPGTYLIQWTRGAWDIKPDDTTTPFVPNSNVLTLEVQDAKQDAVKPDANKGDLRSGEAAGSGDPRRAQIVQLDETARPNDKAIEEQRKLPPPKGEIYDAARPNTDRFKPNRESGAVSGAISGKKMFGQFTGRVRLKTEKPLPDLEKVIVPAGKVLDESLVFSKDGGLANVFVYLQKPTFPIEPLPSNRPPKPFVLIAEGERFWPHASFVRVGRPVVFENRKTEPVNFRMGPLKNVSFNVLAKMQEHVKIQAFRYSEVIPFAIKSDIQPWMQTHVLTLDHPFAAVTDEEGRFTIDGLPQGEHEFRVWHERVGYLEKSLVVTIQSGQESRSALDYVPSRFELEEAEILNWGNRQINAARNPVPQPIKQAKE